MPFAEGERLQLGLGSDKSSAAASSPGRLPGQGTAAQEELQGPCSLWLPAASRPLEHEAWLSLQPRAGEAVSHLIQSWGWSAGKPQPEWHRLMGLGAAGLGGV